MAWGLRNAYGLGFLPDGRLIATEQSADARGSRPIGNAPDALYVVEQGAWYGWPDFVVTRNNSANLLFKNRGVEHRHSFSVLLQGEPGNPRAVGARISVGLADGLALERRLFHLSFATGEFQPRLERFLAGRGRPVPS